jgi:hypothetical protein
MVFLSNGLGWRFVPYKDSQGNPTLKEIPTETHVVNENKIMLHGKINENKGISITGYKEIPFGTIPSAIEYAVDYDERMITFHPSIEGKTVNVHYFSEGSMVLDNASIATFDGNGNPISTFADEVTAIKADYQTIKTAFEEFCNANTLKFKWYSYIPTQVYTTFPLSLIPNLVYNPVTDTMIILSGNLPLREGADYDYVLSGSDIIFANGVVTTGNDLHFLMLRGYILDTTVPTGDGSLIMNGSITKMKLDASLQALIDSITLKALNTDNARTTTDKTVTGAINELNTNKIDKTKALNLIDYGTTSTDANTATTDGLYSCANWTNRPVVNAGFDQYGKILAISYHPSFVKQIYFCTYYHNRIFSRSRSSGVWSDWEEFVFKDNTVPYAEITAATNISTTVGRGIYTGTTWTNYPTGASAIGILEVLRVNSTTLKQIYHDLSSTKTFYRNQISGAWTSWQQLATTMKSSLTLQSGWVGYDNVPYMSVVGNQVVINMRIKGGTISDGTAIANIGKPPIATGIYFEVKNINTSTTVGWVYVDDSGILKILDMVSNIDCMINISYTTA